MQHANPVLFEEGNTPIDTIVAPYDSHTNGYSTTAAAGVESGTLFASCFSHCIRKTTDLTTYTIRG